MGIAQSNTARRQNVIATVSPNQCQPLELTYFTTWFRGGHLLPPEMVDQKFVVCDGNIKMSETDGSDRIPFQDNIDLKILYQDNRSVHALAPMISDMFSTTVETKTISQDALEYLLQWLFIESYRLPPLSKWKSILITYLGKLILSANK